MIIAGAGGHAKELFGILPVSEQAATLCFFDNTKSHPALFREKFNILCNEEAVKDHFLHVDNRFIIGVGKPFLREQFYHQLLALGGKPNTVIAANAAIPEGEMYEDAGLNIMQYAVITEDVQIGRGSLVHVHVSVHHDVVVGDFCELSPGCRLLGQSKVGNNCSIGSGAILLPGITVGEHCVIGAGAVVTKNIPAHSLAVGVPARVVKTNVS
ncbi:MAG: NeuD/PglB/VioB family sugar acetyltransferase [Chitinophagaceae bacterium]|nr:NeuD/PglB/VioB family sugar acetyltransferase [Chitinophagaceae bacterium]